MASAGDIHSILYRGDVLKAPVPRYDPSKHVQRHFPGKYADEEDDFEASDSELTEEQLAPSQARERERHDTSLQDRRLKLLESIQNQPDDIGDDSDDNEAIKSFDVCEEKRVVKRRREIVETGRVLLLGEVEKPTKRLIAESVSLQMSSSATSCTDDAATKHSFVEQSLRCDTPSAAPSRHRVILEPIIVHSAASSEQRPVSEKEQPSIAGDVIVTDTSIEEDITREERRRRALERRRQEEEQLALEAESARQAQDLDASSGVCANVDKGATFDNIEDDESDFSEDSDEDDDGASLRPVFIPASKRALLKEQALAEKREQEELEEKKKLEREERMKESKALLAETVRSYGLRGYYRRQILREEAEVKRRQDEASRGSWDPESMPDDSDDVDEEMEYELWRARELKRILRDKEEEQAYKRLQEHIERRRHMTDEERQEDDRRLDALQPKAEEKQKYKFLQKYYHKGAFFQDLAASGAEPLYLRDFNVPVGEDAVNKQVLPTPMRLRRGQFGKAGQVKHTHLADVDTTDYSAAWAQKNSLYAKKQNKLAGYKAANVLERPSAKKPLK